jgi:hypothetical protein
MLFFLQNLKNFFLKAGFFPAFLLYLFYGIIAIFLQQLSLFSDK